MFMGYGNTMQASVDRKVALAKSRAQLRYYNGLGGKDSFSNRGGSGSSGGSGGGGDYSRSTKSSSSSSSNKNTNTKSDQSVVGQSNTTSGSTFGDTVTTDQTVDTDYKFEDVGDVTDPNNVRGYQAMGSDGNRQLSHMDRHGGPRRIGDTVNTRGVVGTEGFNNAFTDTNTNQQTKSSIATNTSASAKSKSKEKIKGYSPQPQQSTASLFGSNPFGGTSTRSSSRSSPSSYNQSFGSSSGGGLGGLSALSMGGKGGGKSSSFGSSSGSGLSSLS